MKNNSLKYFFILFALPFLFSCERELETEGISRVTNYPTFKMEGDQFQTLVVGGTYTEQGVTATESGASLPVTISGTVDPTTVGFYDITYSAINSDNFPGTITRTIAVLPSAPDPTVDISGNYKNVGGNATTANFINSVKKLSPGFYSATNVWGGTSAAVIPAYFYSLNGTNIVLPESALSPYGRVTGTGTLSATGLMQLSVSLLDQGVANSTRRWQKQ